MRLSSLAWGLLLGATARVAAQDDFEDDEIPEDKSLETTTFDGIKVPPMLELTPDNFDTEIKKSKYILVKHYRCVPGPQSCSTWPGGIADMSQSILPTLPGLRANLSHTVRVLLHRSGARPRQIVRRILRLALCNDKLCCVLRPMRRKRGPVVSDVDAVRRRREERELQGC